MHALLRLLLAIPLAACSEQPEREAWAIVVSIAPHPNPEWDSDEIVVTARTEDGAFGSKRVLIARLNCRVAIQSMDRRAAWRSNWTRALASAESSLIVREPGGVRAPPSPPSQEGEQMETH